MIVTRIQLKNWRNFQSVDVQLGYRVFLVGPNASGKSNFLDVFRFLREIAKDGGGLQKAVSDRGGLSKIRCLAARRYPNVEIEVELAERQGAEPLWRYSIALAQEPRGRRQPLLAHERVWKEGRQILSRPDEMDRKDPTRLTQTHLEQVNSNLEFREIARFFAATTYLHLVPQLLKKPEMFRIGQMEEDLFGRLFLERLSNTPEKTRKARLRLIEKALTLIVPQLKQLNYTEERGVPHLEAVYEHWRPNAGKQREDQFSDGTLRLIGLLWSLLETDSLLLLEEPELSLNKAIVTRLPGLFFRLTKKKKRQVLVSTHSEDLLTTQSIEAEEVLLLSPDSEGTRVQRASDIEQVRELLKAGFTPGEAVMPLTTPPHASQLELFR